MKEETCARCGDKTEGVPPGDVPLTGPPDPPLIQHINDGTPATWAAQSRGPRCKRKLPILPEPSKATTQSKPAMEAAGKIITELLGSHIYPYVRKKFRKSVADIINLALKPERERTDNLLEAAKKFILAEEGCLLFEINSKDYSSCDCPGHKLQDALKSALAAFEQAGKDQVT